MTTIPPSPAPRKTKTKRSAAASSPPQAPPSPAHASGSSDRERFDGVAAGEEDWTMIAEAVAANHRKQAEKEKKAKLAAQKERIQIEEVESGDEEETTTASKSKTKSKDSTGAKKPQNKVPLTPTQRKALQKGNKNHHTGSKKPFENELINEEDDADADGHVSDGSASEFESDDDDGDDEGRIRWDKKKRDEDESESESGSDEEGEAAWEKKPKQKATPGGDSAADKTSSSSFKSILFYLAIAAVILGLIWVRLQDASLWQGFDPDDVDMTTKPPSEQEDYYQILQIERTADLKQIKASYRKLVLLTHPDKNPDCTDCITKFQSVQKAYDVLSNPEKRSMYDSIETTYDLLKSETTELTSANFESEVLHQDAIWVIQVYTDWHKSAIRFSQAWEECAQRYGELVSFGRVHAQRERELTRRFPIKHGVIPTVVVYANGKFSDAKTFLDSSHQALNKLSHFIAHHFPNTVTSVGHTSSAIREFMSLTKEHEDEATVLFFPDFIKNAANHARKQRPPQSGSHQQRFQQQMLQTNTQSINEPTLTYKAVARKFQYAVRFGQVEQLSEPNSWKNWIKDISQAFKLSPPTQLPAILYQEAGESSPKWLTGDLNKEKLLKHVGGMYRRMIPWFNSHSYARHCVESPKKNPTICVIGIACQPLKIGDLEYNSFASGARALQKQAAFKNLPLQFAKIDVAKQTDMAPLCQALPESVQKSHELTIVVLSNHATELAHFGSSDHQSQQFDAWLQHLVKQDGKVKTIEAPNIPVVHIPEDVLPLNLPGVGQLFIPLIYLYGFGVVFALIIAAPLISQYSVKIVYFVFALSILVPGYELLKDVYEKLHSRMNMETRFRKESGGDGSDTNQMATHHSTHTIAQPTIHTIQTQPTATDTSNPNDLTTSSSLLLLPGSYGMALFRHRWTESFIRFTYLRSIWIHIGFIVLVCVMCRLINPNVLAVDTPVANPLRAVLVIITLAEIIILLLAHIGLWRELSTIELVRPWTIWNMYLSILICFCTVYFTSFAITRNAFNLQGYAPDVNTGHNTATDDASSIIDDEGGTGDLSDVTNYNDVVAIYIFFLYFSSAIITSTGFGDIIPTRMPTQMLTNLEMLIGLVYHAGVFGFALDHFMRLQRRRKLAVQQEKTRQAQEAEAKRKRDQALLVSVRDDSIVREPSTDPSSSPITPGIEVTGHRMFRPPSSLSLVHSRRASTTSVSSLTSTPSPSSPPSPAHVPQRVLLSNPTSPNLPLASAIRTDEDDRYPPDSDDDFDGLSIGVLEPMDMSHEEQSLPPYRSLFAPSSSSSSSQPSDLPPPLSLPTAPVSSAALASFLPASLHVAPHTTFFSQFAFWRSLKQRPWFERIRRFVIEYLFGVELVLQMLSSSLMFVLRTPFTGLDETDPAQARGKIAVLVFASLFLIVQLALNASISMRLMNKIVGGSFTEVSNEHGHVIARIPKEGVTASFLTQSYLSTVLVFASVYFFLFAFTPTHEFSRGKEFDLAVVEVWFTFMYFSVTVMTGTGFGDMYSRGVLSRIVASIQMLISIIYACIIIGLGMFVMCEQLEKKAKDQLLAQEKAVGQLLAVVQHRHGSASSSTRASATGTPAQADLTATVEPPLLSLLHDPELLRTLALNDVPEDGPDLEE